MPTWIGPLRAGLLLFLCTAQVLAQNTPATVAVDANAARHPINPNIYGFAFGAQADLAATNFTLNRSGGNGTSTYNWQLNASNHASDWYFESILDPPELPGYDGDTFITQTRAANVGAQPLMTIPMIQYLANLGSGGAMQWSFSIAKYGPQTGSDPYQPDAGNGISSATGNPITGNNPLDAYTPNAVSIQQGWMQRLIGTWGPAASGGLKYYIMDNEPSLWSSTHRDIHPACESYSELFNDYVSYAGAVRALDPNAIIVGPEEWSWWALFVSGCDQLNGTGAAGSDYNTHNQTYYYPWLLQQLSAYQQSTGAQLLNVVSVHYYPQELSNSNDDSLSGQLMRNQSTRALWDPTYVDPSWFNQVGINGGIVNLIPTLKSLVSQYYPGLQTAITEYNWGDEANLNGATAQADVLGIFGQQGLDIATRWSVPLNPSPTYLSLEMYRNYDGKLSTFGDTSVSATVANPDYLSSFAAVRSSDGALTVMVINKQQGSTPLTLSLANFGTTGTAQAYQIASAAQTAITPLGSVAISNNAITTTLPSQSITLFVIPAGSVTTLPSAPTGLSATVGGGAVNLPTFSSSASASPNPVPQGVSDTITATVTCTFGTLTNGIVQILVHDPSGNTAATQNFTGQNFTAQQTSKYSLAFTPAYAGVYTVEVGVFSATWLMWNWNASAASITANSSMAFTSSAAVPSTLAVGGIASISATVTETGGGGLTGANVELQIFNSAGSAVATQVWSSQNFSSGQGVPYSYSWTPGATVAPGSYTVDVGVFNSSWSQQYYWNTDATIGLTAALSTPAVSLSTSALTFTSQNVGVSSSAQSVTLTNTGTGSLAITGISVGGANAGDFTQTNTCGASVAAGAKCAISATFKPTAVGSRTASVSVANNATGSAQSITVSGTGVGVPAVSLSSSALTFTSQNVGVSSSAQSVTLTNTGTGSLAITGISVGGANASDFTQTNTCGASIAAGAKCSISATFKPTAVGSRTASVSIADNASGSAQSITVSGTGVGVPVVSLSTSALTFTSQNVGASSSAQSVTLTNTGTGSLAITGISVGGANAGDFTQTNTCGASIAASAKCSISATFKPTAVGSRTASVSVANNASGSAQSITVSGTGVGVPAVSLSTSALTFTSQNVGVSSSAQSVTLTNTGTGSLAITGISVGGANAGDFTQTNTCGASVTAGAKCSISATFKPTAVGNRTASISIADNASGSAQSIMVSGTGVGVPAVSLSTSALTFTSQNVGASSSAQSVTLTNTGTGSLAITGISIGGANASDFTQTNTCGASVAASAKCSISATFKPTAVGSRTAAISIADNASGSAQSITLSGTGVGVPAVSLSTSALTFTSQNVGTSSSAQSVTLINTGTGSLTITSISIGGANASDFTQTNTCGASVAAGAQCAISATFKPTAVGSRTAAISIADNATGSAQSITLTGTGVGVPAVSLSTSALTFTSQNVGASSNAQSVTLTNTGTGTLAITSISIGGADAGDFTQTNTCGASIAAGAQCAIAATFKPTAGGRRAASISIADNATGSPQSITLSGTGVGVPAVTLNLSALTFTSQNVGTSSSAQSVTLTNTGTGSLAITGISVGGANAGDFAETKTCGASIAAGAQCSISATFKPTAAGNRTAVISITDSATGSPQSFTLSGTGVAVR